MTKMKSIIKFIRPILISFLVAIYLPVLLDIVLTNPDRIFKGLEFDQTEACSPNSIYCAYFKFLDYSPCSLMPTLCDDFYIGKVSIYNQASHEYVLIDVNTGIKSPQEDSPPHLKWTNNNQLDVYLENENFKNTENYFFKRLGNIKVIIHGRE